MTYAIPTEWKSEKWWRNRPTDERLHHLNIPKRWRSIKFNDLTLSRDIINQAQTWLDNYERGSSLYIYGRSGAGKTTLAQSLAQLLVADQQLSGRFLGSDRYIDMLHDSFDHNNELPEMYSSRHLLKYIQGVFDILVLDGVGQERDTEFTRHEIGSLVRRRYEDQRTVIITSSMNPMDFIRRYGDRIKVAVSEMDTIKVDDPQTV